MTSLAKFWSCAVVAALMAVPTAGLGQEATQGWTGVAIAAVGLAPEYEGAKNYRVFPAPAGRFQHGRRYVALDGLTGRANLLTSTVFEFGPVATLTFGRDRDIESAAVAALPQIDDTVSLGLFAARVWRGVGPERGEARVQVQAVHDVGDVYGGWTGTVSAGYSAPVGERWFLSGEIGARMVSDDYAATYFGVTHAGAAASGLAVYNAQGGLNDVGASLTASYALTERWSVTGFAGYSRLLGDAADSPIVRGEGSADQFGAGLGLGFAF